MVDSVNQSLRCGVNHLPRLHVCITKMGRVLNNLNLLPILYSRELGFLEPILYDVAEALELQRSSCDLFRRPRPVIHYLSKLGKSSRAADI